LELVVLDQTVAGFLHLVKNKDPTLEEFENTDGVPRSCAADPADRRRRPARGRPAEAGSSGTGVANAIIDQVINTLEVAVSQRKGFRSVRVAANVSERHLPPVLECWCSRRFWRLQPHREPPTGSFTFISESAHSNECARGHDAAYLFRFPLGHDF
jgi:hypothetical protein